MQPSTRGRRSIPSRGLSQPQQTSPSRSVGCAHTDTQASHQGHWTLPLLGPVDLASGATASSEGAQLVCRLPLAALRPWTSDFQSRRPAAVMQYDDKGHQGSVAHMPFIGADGHHICFLAEAAEALCCNRGHHQCRGCTALLSGRHMSPW